MRAGIRAKLVPEGVDAVAEPGKPELTDRTGADVRVVVAAHVAVEHLPGNDPPCAGRPARVSGGGAVVGSAREAQVELLLRQADQLECLAGG